MGHEHEGTLYRDAVRRQGSRREDRPEATTWTLVSLDEQGRLVRVWHQHGEGAIPVRLEPEPVASTVAPSLSARAYACEECEALTLVSRPVPALS